VLPDIAADTKSRKLAEDLPGPDLGFARKLREIVKVFETHQDVFIPIARTCGVGLTELRSAAQWSDLLRDTRNAIHHGVQPYTDRTYETASVFLLAAVPHLVNIEKLVATVRNSHK
jgi:hypothetical protein